MQIDEWPCYYSTNINSLVINGYIEVNSLLTFTKNMYLLQYYMKRLKNIRIQKNAMFHFKKNESLGLFTGKVLSTVLTESKREGYMTPISTPAVSPINNTILNSLDWANIQTYTQTHSLILHESLSIELSRQLPCEGKRPKGF